jgi:hypothetical protein
MHTQNIMVSWVLIVSQNNATTRSRSSDNINRRKKENWKQINRNLYTHAYYIPTPKGEDKIFASRFL